MKTQSASMTTAVVLGLCLLTGCSGEVRIENPNFQDSQESAPSEQVAEPSEDAQVDETSQVDASLFTGRVGDKVVGDGFEVSLNSARFDKGGQFFEPDNGYYLILNFSVANTSNDELSLSSWGSFELQGSDLYIYSVALGAETKGTLDSTIAPGGSLRGEIAFDVPALDSYELRFKPELFSGFKVIFSVDSSAVQGG